MLPACAEAHVAGILDGAMTAIDYIECDVPEGMALAEWRRARARRKQPRRIPRLRIRLA
jgi:hypothetical protein